MQKSLQFKLSSSSTGNLAKYASVPQRPGTPTAARLSDIPSLQDARKGGLAKGRALVSRLIGVLANFPLMDGSEIAACSGGTSTGECLGLGGVWAAPQVRTGRDIVMARLQ